MRTIESIESALRDARRELARMTPYSREWLAVRNLVERLEQRRGRWPAPWSKPELRFVTTEIDRARAASPASRAFAGVAQHRSCPAGAPGPDAG